MTASTQNLTGVYPHWRQDLSTNEKLIVAVAAVLIGYHWYTVQQKANVLNNRYPMAYQS